MTPTPSLRSRMGWLHAWIGFVGGLILVGIFATGSLAVFDSELTHWMQPETPHVADLQPSPEALDAAAKEILTLEEQHAARVFVSLPSARDPLLRVVHLDHDVIHSSAFDPASGKSVNLRDTAGGLLFFNFHYTLHMGHFFGVIVVQIIAIGMLVTLGSGVIIHLKSLLPNLVVFRPRATSPRPWVDAHVLTAVLFLPFLFTIAYTGVLIHANRLFPNTAIQRPDRGGGGGHGQHHSVPLPPLAPVLADAATKYGPDKLGFLQFSPRTISVFRADGSTIRLTRDHLEYDRKTGERLKEVSKDSPAASTSQFLSGIHMARWAPATVRWFYFASGIAGYVMFATGLVMFLLKRRRKAEGRSPLGMVLAEGLTLATVLGLPLACVGVLWANRLLPAGMTSRVETETSTLFLVWAVAALHALLRGGGLHILRGWREQATLLSATLLLLPALDVATRWHWMGMQDQNVYFAVDAVAFALGLSALHLRRVLSRKETVRPDDLVSLSGGVKL